MVSKSKSVWVCSNCGYETIKWSGQCPSCSEWNTINEEFKTTVKCHVLKDKSDKLKEKPVLLNHINIRSDERYSTNILELDRVLGGGIVKGSVVLLGGKPGTGKSTILLQVCNNIANTHKVLYVSGEESKHQIKLRASRLCTNSENLYVMTETDIETIAQEIQKEMPDLVIIDSIQTMNYSELSSSNGSVSQIKECTNILLKVAKLLDIPIIIVGHVNKDGAIAGPKVLEHMVDVVLYFEGDKQLSYKILRSIKNRYGSTNEIGVFQMTEQGLIEVDNPSIMLLSGKPQNVSGTCVSCIMEGTRPIFVEVQGLITTSNFGNPRRMAIGFDYNRMSLLLAILEKRSGYFFSNLDAYINVVGGLKLDEPASDLSVAISLISSLKDKVIIDRTVVFGEIGLAGEIRAVSHADERVKEAERLGFKNCILPQHNLNSLKDDIKNSNINLIGVDTIKEAFEAICK